MNSSGAGSGITYFQPCAAVEVSGRRVEPKICQICGKGFFRDAPGSALDPKAQKDCDACVLRLAAAKAREAQPIPGVTASDVRRERYQESYPKISEANRRRAEMRKLERRKAQAQPQARVYLLAHRNATPAATTTIH